jgi:hypothetical protein
MTMMMMKTMMTEKTEDMDIIQEDALLHAQNEVEPNDTMDNSVLRRLRRR